MEAMDDVIAVAVFVLMTADVVFVAVTRCRLTTGTRERTVAP